MNLWLSILVAGFGGFVGDQIYFYLGRFNKDWVLRELKAHRRKFARARLLLRKYGGFVIFLQRFIYGMRTIIPMAIAISGYDPKKYAIINFISAFIWASLTIIPAYFFGEELLALLKWAKAHWYIAITFVILLWSILYYLNKKEEQ
jgi:membrane protein DedA with SNARE-associated domain